MDEIDILYACVDEMYQLGAGARIDYPEEIIVSSGQISISRKQIKHVIENRKADGKSPGEIKQILDYLVKTISKFDFEIENPNQKYPGSIIRVKVFKKWNRGMILVLDKQANDHQRALITAYPYRLLNAYLLFKKVLYICRWEGATPVGIA